MKRASPSPDAPRPAAAFIAVRIALGTVAIALAAVLVLALSFGFDLPGLDSLETSTGAQAKQQQRVRSLEALRNERRSKVLEQERLAEVERRAATARADAEIARARRTPDTRSVSGLQREAPPTQATASTPTTPGAAPVTATTDRVTAYDELVSEARALIDAGRYAAARATAQRALFADPRRMAARTLWAEAQTRLDEMQSQPFDSRPRPRRSF